MNMKRLLAALAVLLCAVSARAQTPQPLQLNPSSATPVVGQACLANSPIVKTDGAGAALYQCVGSPPVWRAVGGGGAPCAAALGAVQGNGGSTFSCVGVVDPTANALTTLGTNAGDTPALQGNTLIGYGAGQMLGTGGTGGGGFLNTFVGNGAGGLAQTCSECTAVGHNALQNFVGDGTGNEDGVETAVGEGAGSSEAQGFENVFVGHEAGNGCATTWSNNTFVGTHIRQFAGCGNDNVILGHNVGDNRTTANFTIGQDVIIGSAALEPGTGNQPAGSVLNSVIIGQAAAANMQAASQDVVVGQLAATNLGASGTGATEVTIVGYNAATSFNTGTLSTFVGSKAGGQASGSNDTVVGAHAVFLNDGGNNTVIGENALGGIGGTASNTNNNVVVGYVAANANGFTGAQNTILGSQAINGAGAAPSGAVIVGYQAGVAIGAAVTKPIYIGYQAGQGDTASNDIIISSLCLTTANCQHVTGGQNTYINSSTIDTATSSLNNVYVGANSGPTGTSTAETLNTAIGAAAHISGASTTGAVQLGSGTNSASNTLQYGTAKLADSSGNHFAAHLNQSASGSFAGTIAISSGTVGTFTFNSAFTSVPVCVVSPEASLGAATYGYAKSTTAVTVTLSASGSATFDVICVGAPN
jgi:trimeric autotransporter adhesin